MGVFTRSWEITQLSMSVMKKDKELLLFPLIGGIFSILFLIAMLFPTVFAHITAGETLGFMQYLIIFISYLGLAFIATFFNTCVVYTTKIRFEHGDATFLQSITFALSKLHNILAWSLVAATVGVLLRIIDNLAERMGNLGRTILKIINSLIGMVWGIVTIFVIPAMVYHDLGPFDAIKKSVSTIKKTWGESLIRYYGLGLVQFFFLIIGIAITIGLFLLTYQWGTLAIILTIILAALYFIGVILIFNVANQIFNTALYVYADTGKVPLDFDTEHLENAFRRT